MIQKTLYVQAAQGESSDISSYLIVYQLPKCIIRCPARRPKRSKPCWISFPPTSLKQKEPTSINSSTQAECVKSKRAASSKRFMRTNTDKNPIGVLKHGTMGRKTQYSRTR